MKKILLTIAFVFIILSPVSALNPSVEPSTVPELHLNHGATEWIITASYDYDLLCYFNILTADDLTMKNPELYSEYTGFLKECPDNVKTAVIELSSIKQLAGNGIGGGVLAVYYRVCGIKDLRDFYDSLADPDRYYTNLVKLNFIPKTKPENLSPQEEQTYVQNMNLLERYRLDFITVLDYLEQVDYRGYWQKNILPKETESIRKFSDYLSDKNFDIIPLIEKYTGVSLHSNTVTVYYVYNEWGYGSRLPGTTAFLANCAMESNYLVRTALHEMMHPPYIQNDPRLAKAIQAFEKDEFFMKRVRDNTVYKSLPSLFEEECVDALEFYLGDSIGVSGEDALTFFSYHQKEINGLNIIAPILYQLMKAEKFGKNNEVFQDFLLKMIEKGKLKPGKLKEQYQKIYVKWSEES